VNTISFEKYQGLGNDFLVVQQGTQPFDREVAKALCDRHRGVGGDGVLVVSQYDANMRMEVLNADGSRPEMCGNGLRCVVLDLVRRGWAKPDESFVVETDAGPHRVTLRGANLQVGDVEIEMRAPRFAAREVPFVSDVSERVMRDEVFTLKADGLPMHGRSLRFSAATMGNPHVVTFDVVTTEEARVWGPFMEAHPDFPEHANAGFASITGAQSMDLRVFERGVGWTEACGTGACAAAALAVETGRIERHVPISVKLPGGTLIITVRGPLERILMRGPAAHVFSGTVAQAAVF